MEFHWFAIVNMILFLLQSIVSLNYTTIFYEVSPEHETLITPAPFGSFIWILIYVLEALIVVVDIVYPYDSLYADASQPMKLRLSFAGSCLANISWVIFSARHEIYHAMLSLITLWVFVLILYLYVKYDWGSFGFYEHEWCLFIVNELPLSLYFSWLTTLLVVTTASALELVYEKAWLTLPIYVFLITIITSAALFALICVNDFVFATGVAWYLFAVVEKELVMENEAMKITQSCVRACVIQSMQLIGLMAMYMIGRLILCEGYVPPCQKWFSKLRQAK